VDHDEQDDQELAPPRPAEGVRIIGAEEAAAAIEAGQVAPRRPEDAPKFGDVPEAPAGPRPALRFPQPDSSEPTDVVKPPIVRPRPGDEGYGRDRFSTGPSSGSTPEMPHWSEPPTGEVPQILGDGGDPEDAGEDLGAWSALARPRWRDQSSDWDDADFAEGELADDELRVGALDPNRTAHSDLFSFDEPNEPEADEPRRGVATASVSSRPRRDAPDVATAGGGGSGGGSGAGRDTGVAVGTGIGIAVVALILFKAGPAWALLIAIAVLTLAAVEIYDVLRRAGYKPATLLGITATVSIMIAAYNKGEAAIPLVVALAVITSFLWYLLGVETARPTINILATLGGFLWVGFLGSFAALLLNPARFPHRHGVAFLLAAVVATVFNDIGAFVFGRQLGRRPMAPAISPHKTWEGFFGGMATSVFVTTIVIGAVPGLSPWNLKKAFLLAVVVSIVAPLGDLAESMVKRDIGIKDMGSILPGHGGVLDRFDAMLFVLPTTYFLVKLLFKA
jgi:phosphatidate cytidylyltransferase